MTQIEKHPIAEFGLGSSIDFAMRKSLEQNNIEYEIQIRTEVGEGFSFDIAVFMVSSSQTEEANRLVEIVIRNNPSHPSYQKFNWIGIWILSIAILIILTMFLINIYGVL